MIVCVMGDTNAEAEHKGWYASGLSTIVVKVRKLGSTFGTVRLEAMRTIANKCVGNV